MSQELLDRLIGAAPPSTVDVEAVITRTRRRQRVLRAAASGSVAVAVLVATLVGVGLAGRREPVPVAQQPVPPAASSPASTPSAGVPADNVENDTAGGRQRTLDRLRTAVERATAAHAPGTAWIYMPDARGEKRTPDGHLRMWTTKDPWSFEGRSGITGGGRKGGFYVSLRPAGCAGGQSCSPLYECDGTVPACEKTTTSGGLTLVHYVDEPGNGWLFYGVDVLLPGGDHALRMTAVNYFGGDGSPPSATMPVLSRDQLDAIAVDVAGEFTG
ncbi:hypothetical protein BJY16_007155 [Actinoplanes octamycinicus]|uniref:Uncharacterized protein n=1 Tax=Actinoplanes octamycinicus TaxID=135948 RepID=A0A7W7H4A0_9ACTN|nr:hypothetical protein [Actinoplanes octamycinicus]MBB4743696.1 hypothetical protein [Actinoplanes octamycinicus]GIE61125.1 hypothetical protein Aoc01nite_65270 [Actinoplanes octamycinicus]